MPSGGRTGRAIVQHLLGHARGVLAHLGDRDVTLGDVESGRLDLRLKSAELPEVFARAP